ncbi:MAG: peroxidase, partial [Saccharothrix sp.]|nr:peroxidase [Saccharothrix sp.]
MRRADHLPSRRRFLDVTGAMAAAGLAAGCTSDSARPGRNAPSEAASSTPAAVPVTGRYQAGVTLPSTAQRNLLAVVADLDDAVAPGPLLAGLGRAIRALVAGTDPRLLGLPPGDLTVTVGVGPRLVRKAGASLPGAADLPRFSRERVAPQ